MHKTNKQPTAANRLSLDYAAEAHRLGPPVRPIIDAHAHINGPRACRVWKRAADHFGVVKVYTQTQLAQAAQIRAALGDIPEFIAIPEYMASSRQHAFTQGFIDNLERWASEFGARCVKHWAAPRFIDIAAEFDEPEKVAPIDSYWRRKVADRAVELGMMLMAHIADPDTWFATKYTDASTYGSKRSHHDRLEIMLETYKVPWLLAHMGGSPEDLPFLTGLLERHPHAILDTSATKWMVRELSKHPREELLAFLTRFKGRILFGSDIVTHDDHLAATDPNDPKFGAQLANNEDEAYDLYASRYWALRTMLETDYQGESNIADPDLMMVDPANHNEMSAPTLSGKSLPRETLLDLYGQAAESTMQAWFDAHR